MKASDDQFSPSLRYFSERIPVKNVIQVVQRLEKSVNHKHGVIVNAADWLSTLEA